MLQLLIALRKFPLNVAHKSTHGLTTSHLTLHYNLPALAICKCSGHMVSLHNPCTYGFLGLECSLCPYPAPLPGQHLVFLHCSANDHVLGAAFRGTFYHTVYYYHVLLHSVSPVVCDASLPHDS